MAITITDVTVCGTRFPTSRTRAEHVDHLHEQFEDPCVVDNAACMPPSAPDFSISMKRESGDCFAFGGNA